MRKTSPHVPLLVVFQFMFPLALSLRLLLGRGCSLGKGVRRPCGVHICKDNTTKPTGETMFLRFEHRFDITAIATDEGVVLDVPTPDDGATEYGVRRSSPR